MVSKNQIKLVKSLEQKKHRLQQGMFVAEGPKVVGDLQDAGFAPAHIFATPEWADRQTALHASCTTIVSADELRKLSFAQHPQQVLAVFRLPQASARPKETPGLILALDGVQDPGNLGTIIRVADWFGIGHIVCSSDTADCWSPKVVQATMGSIARVQVDYLDLPHYIAHSHLPVYGTVLDGGNIYQTGKLADRAIIVMGNEGRGISEPVQQLLTHRLLIPQFSPGADSLNVAIATAITCSEFRRTRFV